MKESLQWLFQGYQVLQGKNLPSIALEDERTLKEFVARGAEEGNDIVAVNSIVAEVVVQLVASNEIVDVAVGREGKY